MAKSIDTSYRSVQGHSAGGDDPGRKGMGIRETSTQRSGPDKELDENRVEIKDVGDARTLGPVRAAYIISPTREAKNFRWTSRKV